MTDPENIGFIPQRMKKLSKDHQVPSEKSFSSGDGNYDDAESDLSHDSDLATLKILTKEGAANR